MRRDRELQLPSFLLRACSKWVRVPRHFLGGRSFLLGECTFEVRVRSWELGGAPTPSSPTHPDGGPAEAGLLCGARPPQPAAELAPCRGSDSRDRPRGAHTPRGELGRAARLDAI